MSAEGREDPRRLDPDGVVVQPDEVKIHAQATPAEAVLG